MSLYPDGRIVCAASGANRIGLITFTQTTQTPQTSTEKTEFYTPTVIFSLFATIVPLAGLVFLLKRKKQAH